MEPTKRKAWHKPTLVQLDVEATLSRDPDAQAECKNQGNPPVTLPGDGCS